MMINFLLRMSRRKFLWEKRWITGRFTAALEGAAAPQEDKLGVLKEKRAVEEF